MDELIAVELRNASVHYVSYADRSRWRRREITIPALQNIDLVLRDGDAIGVVGHNGSGKSTLLQLIAGLLPPTSGSVLVSSQPQLLGVRAALSPMLSGHRNIELCCLALGVAPRDVEQLAEEIAEFTELDRFLELPVHTYSSGMMQRLSFAISASSRPSILLVDEALAVGDYGFKLKCLAKLRDMRADAGVIMLATHSMAEIEQSCNMAMWMHEGRIEMAGDPDEVITAYEENTKTVNRSFTMD